MTAEALDVFQMSVWAPTDLIEIRSFPPEHKRGTRHPWQRWLKASEFTKMADELKALNATEMNIYAGMLPRSADGGGSDTDCLEGWVVWSDFDHTTPEAALETVAAVGLPEPTLVVNSGHGAQCHWGLSAKMSPDEISRLVGNIAEVTGADTKVRNPSRVMRLPGFINHNLKPTAAPASVFKSNLALRYDFAVLRALVPDCTEAIWKAENYIATIPGLKEHEGRNSKGFQVAAKLRNDRKIPDAPAWRIFCLWNNRNTPPMDDREAREVFDSGLKNAKRPPGNQLPAAVPTNTVPASPRKRLIELTATPTVQPAFMWGKRLPKNALALLCGRPGIGKSFLTLDISARVTTGAPFPGCTEKREPRNVVIFSGEDGPEDIKWRFNELNGDESRVSVLDPGEDLDLTKLAEIEEILTEKKPALWPVDPISCYFGTDTDSHVNTSVRRVLRPIWGLMVKHQCICWCVTHPSKMGQPAAVYSPTGSIAQSAAARSVLNVTEDPAEVGTYLLSHSKVNRAKLQPTLRYRIVNVNGDEDRAKVEWLGEDSRSAAELHAADNSTDTDHVQMTSKKAELASEVILGELGANDLTWNELIKIGHREGVEARTMRRVRDELREQGRIRTLGRQYKYAWHLEPFVPEPGPETIDYPLPGTCPACPPDTNSSLSKPNGQADPA